MHTMRQRLTRDDRGFTLIELLVVIIILGILLAPKLSLA
jgi:prepilin-type N-terminal cleavage/methylation domain-containing protein